MKGCKPLTTTRNGATAFVAAVVLLGCGSSHGTLTVKNDHSAPLTVWINRAQGSSGYDRWESIATIPTGSSKDLSDEIANLGPKSKLRLQPGGGPVQGVAVDPGAFAGSGCGGERRSTVTMKADEAIEYGPGTKATTP